jgi:UDP-N-acetylmuramyl pentapeptide synthase
LTLVDDTFNVNPLGVEAAVSYMQNFNSIKILVLTPMIELGSQADMTHQKVGQYMSDKIDYIFLTNSNYAEEIKKGISQTKSTVKADVIISDPDLFYKLISENRNKIGVVVFEGKEAQRYLDRLIK